MKTLKEITLADIKAVMLQRGYQVFSANGVPNIVGVRSSDRDGEDFDDTCFVWWNDLGKEEVHQYTITTNPGTYYLKNPISNAIGTAILVPGQYKDCWELGSHKGKQKALIQTCGQVRVYRDRNKDGVLNMDTSTIDTGFFGINLHHGSLNDPDVIGQWSAGCQVWKYHGAHEILMNKFHELSKKYHFNRFSYTLLDQAEFK
jgi:hypothetical protein